MYESLTYEGRPVVVHRVTMMVTVDVVSWGDEEGTERDLDQRVAWDVADTLSYYGGHLEDSEGDDIILIDADPRDVAVTNAVEICNLAPSTRVVSRFLATTEEV